MKAKYLDKFEYFSFEEKDFSERLGGIDADDGFVVKIQLNQIPEEKGKVTLFKWSGLEIVFARRDASCKGAFSPTESADRVWLHADEDGTVALVEARAEFRSPNDGSVKPYVVDIPQKLFDASKEPAYLCYDGVKLFFVYGGEEVNADYPYGNIVKAEGENVNREHLACFGMAGKDAIKIEVRTEDIEKNMAFFSPRGYNTWAGDVVNYYRDGVYHMLYFFDRHHHQSRHGAGAHALRHITTRDFKTWTEHGDIIKLDAQWKTAGTGTMFFHKGKYYFSHGWHTTRMMTEEETGSDFILANSTLDKIRGASYSEIFSRGLTPAGSNYAESDDGLSFRSVPYQFHVAENPSIYAESDGSLTMYAGYGSNGIWTADSIEGPWKRMGDFKLDASPLKPSTECPSKFELNGYRYLLIGGTGYWMTEKNGTEFHDEGKEGYDVYDGMFVPMVTRTEDGRLIYGGWLRGYGWASVAVHRELIQAENGRLYMRWLPELEPRADELESVDGFDLSERESYYFEADVSAGENGKVGIRFEGAKDSMLVLDAGRETIQISAVEEGERFPKEILPLYQRARVEDLPHKPDLWGDFTLGRADHLRDGYKLRVIIYYEKKLDSAIIDAEIGGKRTIVSHRVDSRFRSVSWTAESATVSRAKLYRIK